MEKVKRKWIFILPLLTFLRGIDGFLLTETSTEEIIRIILVYVIVIFLGHMVDKSLSRTKKSKVNLKWTYIVPAIDLIVSIWAYKAGHSTLYGLVLNLITAPLFGYVLDEVRSKR